jgi:D-arginine utilization repressor
MLNPQLVSICDALVMLLSPLVEVAIHDIKTDRVVYINGVLSGRQVGDASLLSLDDDTNWHQVMYSKLNFDGRLVKSISIPWEDKWLICLNADTSVFSTLLQLSQQFLATGQSADQPEALFKNDWQEKCHVLLHQYCQQKNWSFKQLTTVQKKTLLKYLFDCGAFQEKNAANYISGILGISRATVFNYLKTWR